jgi:hypothetical protein
MKKLFLAWLAAALLPGPMTVAAADISIQSGFSYQGWSSDAHETGSQLYIPIRMAGDYQHLSWDLKTGYAYTGGDLAGDSERSVSGALDTQVGSGFLLPSWIGLDWLAGLDLNLPTGRTGLDERQVRIMIDPDLLSIVSPGQGFNINPTLSATRRWDQCNIGLGLGYAFQGEYDYSAQTRNYDPGDIFSMAARGDCPLGDIWHLSLQAQYLTSGTDRVEGRDLLQKGDTWLFGTALKRSDDTWDLELAVQGLFRGKAKIKDAGGHLNTEPRDSQGDEWIIDLNGAYRWRPKTRFTGGLTYLYLAENGYERVSAFFMGSRRKLSLSLGWIQDLSDSLDLQCLVAGFSMDDGVNWLHPDGSRDYKGWSLSATVTKHF